VSCGNPHETPCTEVLSRLYTYLDGELDTLTAADVQQHLEECGPCLAEFDVEAVVKKLVQRSCACAPAPEQVRAHVVARLTQVRVTYTEYHEGAPPVS
jgi:mycothiol system anti-sigma-R factor